MSAMFGQQSRLHVQCTPGHLEKRAAQASSTATPSRPQRPRHGLPTFHSTSRHEKRVLCRASGIAVNKSHDALKMSIDLEPQAEGEYCMPGEVILDNESHDQFTILRVEVKDYPGLLRVIAWVLNGLQLTVQNAR